MDESIERMTEEIEPAVNHMIDMFTRTYGKRPKAIVMGMEPAEALMLSLIRKGTITSEKISEFVYQGVKIYISPIGCMVSVVIEPRDVALVKAVQNMNEFSNETSLTHH